MNWYDTAIREAGRSVMTLGALAVVAVALVCVAGAWVWCVDRVLRACKVSEVVVRYLWNRDEIHRWMAMQSFEPGKRKPAPRAPTAPLE